MSNRKRAQADAPGGSFGDALEELKTEGHLSRRQYAAGQHLLRVLQRFHGSSAGLVGQLLDKVDCKEYVPSWPLGGGVGCDLEELEELLKPLPRSERDFLRFLVKHREKVRGTLADWASVKSSYKSNKTRRAATVGRTLGFLDAVAEVCFGPVPSLEEEMEQWEVARVLAF